VQFKISGPSVPVLEIQIDQMQVYFEHHVVLWRSAGLDIKLLPAAGGYNRLIAGMPIYITQTEGRGRIAFSRDAVGEIIPIHLQPGASIDVHRDQFLAATVNVRYAWQYIEPQSQSAWGTMIDTFWAEEPGMLWLNGYGNMYEVMLQPGEVIEVERGGWVYKDRSVGVELFWQSFRTGWFGGGGSLAWVRLTGPGRVGIQSMYYRPPPATE
jgi:uncharacterized protein (AIM24 family)